MKESYIVVQEYSIEALQKSVALHISAGYVPTGFGLNPLMSGEIFYQPMVLKDILN